MQHCTPAIILTSIPKVMIRISKPISIFCLIVMVVFLANGCSGRVEIDNEECCLEPYVDYEAFTDSAFGSFEVDGFNNISKGERLYYSVGIPENSYFINKNDLYEDNSLQPKNRKDIFVDEDGTVLVWMSFLFSKEHLEKEFVTIDEFPSEYEVDQMKEIYPFLSEMFECVLKENHCIVLMKFYPLSELEGSEIDFYRGKVVKFIQSYCDFLNSYSGG